MTETREQLIAMIEQGESQLAWLQVQRVALQEQNDWLSACRVAADALDQVVAKLVDGLLAAEAEGLALPPLLEDVLQTAIERMDAFVAIAAPLAGEPYRAAYESWQAKQELPF